VQEDQLVRPAILHERPHHLVDGVLDVLLAEQAILAVRPRRVEHVEVADLAPRVLHLRAAVVVERVDDVLRRRPQLARGLGDHEVEVLGERHHPAVAREVIAHAVTEAAEQILHDRGWYRFRHRVDGITGTRVVHFAATWIAIVSFFGRHESLSQTANLNVPLIV
jgi:hypothetical protein